MNMNPLIVFLYTKIASTEGFIVIVAISVAVFMLHKQMWRAFAFLISALGLMLSVEILKNIFKVDRPEFPLIEISGYGMPSGHAAGAAFLALCSSILALRSTTLYRYPIVISTALLALSIGFSRVLFQVHTLDQVIAGFVIGCLYALLFLYIETRKTPAVRLWG